MNPLRRFVAPRRLQRDGVDSLYRSLLFAFPSTGVLALRRKTRSLFTREGEDGVPPEGLGVLWRAQDFTNPLWRSSLSAFPLHGVSPSEGRQGHQYPWRQIKLYHWRFAFYITLPSRDSGAAPVHGFSTLCSVWRSSTVYSVPTCTLRSS